MKYDEVKHPSHSHILKSESSETPFKCNGCKETGWGVRYRCEECNYDLHKDCALSSNSISHKKYTLKFGRRAIAGSCCNACGKSILGFVYHYHRKGFSYNLHPCCANLPVSLPCEEGVELRLLERHLWTSECFRCGNSDIWGQDKGWSYRSNCKKYHLHVSCMKDLLKDLVEENWEKSISEGRNNNFSIEISTIPSLQPSSRRKMKKSWKFVAEILNVIFSAVLGNPLGVTLFFVSLLA